MTEHKVYLGDGAYVDVGSYRGEVVITTEDGISVQNQVVLGPNEVLALLHFLKKHDGISFPFMCSEGL